MVVTFGSQEYFITPCMLLLLMFKLICRFVDNVNNNEIVQGASATITNGNPRTSGNSVYVESRINFKPTLNDLCR